MNTKQPEAPRIALYLRGFFVSEEVPAAKAYQIADELERLHAENEQLRAGYDAARLEIASLQARVVELEDETARLTTCLRKANAEFEHFEREWYLRGDEIEALQAQLAAVGAGGVEPLRKRECLHQIRDPREPVAVERIRTMFFPSSPEHSILGIFLSAMSDQLKIDGPAMRDAMLWYCGVQEIATEPQPAAQALDALKKAGSIAVSAVKINSRDIADWRDDMDRIAAIAAQQGGANG